MRLVLTILLSFLGIFAIAKNDTISTRTQSISYEISPELTYPKGFVGTSAEAYAFLIEKFSISEPFDLHLVTEKSSSTQNHYTFAETYKGHEIYRSFAKINTLHSGKITSLSHFLVFNEGEEYELDWSPNNFVAQFESPITIHRQQTVWIQQNGELELATLVNYSDQYGYNFDALLNKNQEELFEFERSEHFHEADSVAKGYVFAPDPLTSASKSYGASFIDNNDVTNPSIDAQRLEVELELLYEPNSQLFSLENDYVKIVELSPPSTLIPTSLTPEFYFDRSQDGFEDVNAFYHITQQQKYIQSLGLMDLANYQLFVDAHGLNGDDNSLFSPGSTPPSLIFGTGGVDDAEDADVVVHEYGHALIESAAPNTNFGLQRNTMDEAFCDYMAASYSRIYSYWQDSWVYNWDGHNEYWNGRTVVSTAMYPADLQNNQYKDAPMWSSALMRIERNIGRDATHQLTLNAAYNFFGGMTMPEGAQLILQQDSILFGSKYYGEVCYTFLDKGLVNNCIGNRPDQMVGLETPEILPFKILNSQGFAEGTGPLRVVGEGYFSLHIYDISGKFIRKITTPYGEINLHPDTLFPGIYLLKWTDEKSTKTVKIIR
jgi:hypothetical protein